MEQTFKDYRRRLPSSIYSEYKRKAQVYSMESNRKTDQSQNQLLTRPQAAEFLGVAISTLDNWARAGLLKRIKVNRAVRYKKESLEQFIDENNKKRITL